MPPSRKSLFDKGNNIVPVIDENVVENAANLQSWVELGDILSTTQNQPERNTHTSISGPETNAASKFKPAPADHSLLLPSTFASAAQKRHTAQVAWIRRRREHNIERENEISKLTSTLVVQAVKAIRQLRTHYDHLISNPIKIRNGLIGHDKGSVIWVSPESQPDFFSFLSMLDSQWGSQQQRQPSDTYEGTSLAESHDDGQRVKDLVDWAMDPDINVDVLHANVDVSAAAYQTIEEAFRTFRLAFDDMVKLHDGDVIGKYSFWERS